MRKASTARSDRRARVRSSGGIFMMLCYVALKDMYIEHLRLPYPRKERVVRIFQCLFAEGQYFNVRATGGFEVEDVQEQG